MKTKLYRTRHNPKTFLLLCCIITIPCFGVVKAQPRAKATVGMPTNKTAKVIVTEMDFVDGPNADNNFDIRTSEGPMLVPAGEPEWKLERNATGVSTIYIKGSKVSANVKLKCTELTNKSAKLTLFSTGDLDFTPTGTAEKTITLAFDANGLATHKFTTVSPLTKVLELKDYQINWQGNALNCNAVQSIYKFFGHPVENWGIGTPGVPGTLGPVNKNEPIDRHVFMLLGPKRSYPYKVTPGQEQMKGEWFKDKLGLKKDDDIPAAAHVGVRTGGSFGGIIPLKGDPWSVVFTETGGLCEDWADLMLESMLLLGVPANRVDRKSVVTTFVTRPTWFGATEQVKLLRAFREPPNGAMWMNEGVTGVLTKQDEDNANEQGKWWYYDVPNTAVGVGGWTTPHDESDNNLWYEPPTPLNDKPANGPVIHTVFPEFWVRWDPQNLDPWNPDPIVNRVKPSLIKLVTTELNFPNVTVNFRTEGVIQVGVQVLVRVYKMQGENAVDLAGYQVKQIQQQWDNLDSVTIPINASGDYMVVATILNTNGQNPGFDAWNVNENGVLKFTKP